MKRKRIDLHLHSSASDGLYSPTEVIRSAVRAGLAAVGLTDHDTTAGVEEALAAGRGYGIEVVPGVEISAYEQGRETHILGYYPSDPEALKEALAGVRRERYQRAELMRDRLSRLGLHLTMDEIEGEAGTAAPGRLHLARLMVKRKFVSDISQAFSLYLARGQPAYFPRTALTPARAMQLLLESGAVPVLAHPGLNGSSDFKKLVPLGLRGVEVYHPEHAPAIRHYYLRQAEAMNLLVTGGSDFHGDRQYRVPQPGSVSVPYSCLEKLKQERFG